MTRPIPAAWGTGAFIEGARHVVDFDIDASQRFEPQPGVQSERRLEPFLAVREGVHTVPPHGQYLDQARWSILDTDGRRAKAVWGPKVH